MTVLDQRSLSELQAELGTTTLLAVSKKKPASAIRALYDMGVRDFGENYCQEALSKMAELQDCNITWHFIGPIQSNKTRDIAENFDWVHSVDRLKIAERLHHQRPENLPPLNVLIQVNVDSESSKSGVTLGGAKFLVQNCQRFDRLTIRGLMCIPTAGKDPRASFAKLRQLKEELGLELLSMGMSRDYQIALDEGSNMVRLGTMLFGKRD